jgi:hypothetical protein
VLFVAHICRDRCAHDAYFSARVCVRMVSYDGDATKVLRETARHGTLYMHAGVFGKDPTVVHGN